MGAETMHRGLRAGVIGVGTFGSLYARVYAQIVDRTITTRVYLGEMPSTQSLRLKRIQNT